MTTFTVQVNAPAGLNLRATPGGTKIGSFTDKTLLTVDGKAGPTSDGNMWWHVTEPQAGYVAQQYTVIVNPPPATGERLITGWNWIEGTGITRDDLLNRYIIPMHASGHPIPLLVVIASGSELAIAAQPYVGQVILRLGNFGANSYNFDGTKLTSRDQAIQAGRQWVINAKFAFDATPAGIGVQLGNEADLFKVTAFDNEFWLGAFMQAADYGREKDFIAFSDSTGNPLPSTWQAREEVLRALMKWGGKVGIHEYGRPPNYPVSDPTAQMDYGMRHVVLQNSVPPDCRPDLYITESGRDDGNFPGVGSAQSDIALYNTQNQHSGAKAVAFYLLGATREWQRASYDSALQWYLTYGQSLLPYNATVIVPPSPSVKPRGVDISHYQNGADLADAKANGISFVIAKASQSNKYADGQYEEFKAQAHGLNMPFAAYHFGDGGVDPIVQADYFLGLVGSDVKVLALDWEPTTGQVTMTPEQVDLFVTHIYDVRGRWPLIYTTYSIAKTAAGNAHQCPLWLAEWGVTAPVAPPQWAKWTIWQDGSSMAIKGASGADSDYFNGSSTDLQAFFNA